MNEIVGIKESILSAAKELSAQKGIAVLNVREVAAACSISVGTVYNHYPDKGALIAAVVEDFWQGVFSTMDRAALCALPPAEALEAFYLQLAGYLAAFQVNWLEQLSLLGASEKQTGRAREKAMLGRIVGFVQSLLESSSAVLQAYNAAERNQLAQFLFDCLFAMLRRGETDFTFAKKLLLQLLG